MVTNDDHLAGEGSLKVRPACRAGLFVAEFLQGRCAVDVLSVGVTYWREPWTETTVLLACFLNKNPAADLSIIQIDIIQVSVWTLLNVNNNLSSC